MITALPICAICFKQLDKKQIMIACDCRKDLVYCEECLMRWIHEKKEKKCEFCDKPYKTHFTIRKIFHILTRIIKNTSNNIFTWAIFICFVEYFIKCIFLIIFWIFIHDMPVAITPLLIITFIYCIPFIFISLSIFITCTISIILIAIRIFSNSSREVEIHN